MIKNQIDKPNSSKCNSSILFKYNSTKKNSEYNRETPSWGGEVTTNGSGFEYDWDGSNIEDVPISNWDLANSDPDAVSAANENLQDKESLGKRFTRIARGLGNAAKTLVSKFGNNSPKTEASPQYNDEWSGSGEYTPPTDTWDTGGYDTGADSFGEPYDFGEEPSPVAETGGSLRSPKVLSGLGEIAGGFIGRAKNILSQKRGIEIQDQPASSWGEENSGIDDNYGSAEKSSALSIFVKKIGEFLKKPETTKVAKEVGMTACRVAMQESGVVGSDGQFSVIGSAKFATRVAANPFGTAMGVGARTARGVYTETSDLRGGLAESALGSVRDAAESRGLGVFVPDTMPTSTGDALDQVQSRITNRSRALGFMAGKIRDNTGFKK